MKDLGWDLKYAVWLVVAVLIVAPLFIIAPLVLLIVVGGVLLVIGLRQILRYRQVMSWEGVPGELKRTEIGTYRVSVGQYSPPVDYYFPLAFFSYEYEGYEGESNQYAFDQKSIWLTDQEKVAKVVAELEEQKSLNVFVNPKNPGEAVINTEVSWSRRSHSWALIVAGVLLLCAGGVLWQYS